MGRRVSKRRWSPPKAPSPKVACLVPPPLAPTTEHSLMARFKRQRKEPAEFSPSLSTGIPENLLRKGHRPAIQPALGLGQQKGWLEEFWKSAQCPVVVLKVEWEG